MSSPTEPNVARHAPVVVRARVDAPLSRWLWLVKWVLLVPHYLVLMLLSVAFVVVAVMALVAIVVTGRYPRDLFEFNLGVLRWSWRVAWYGYSGLGTDRYPPFTLAAVPDYPATLDIPYPEASPRGRSLLQWWLLPAPHYLLLAVLLSGVSWVVVADRLDQPGLTIGSSGLIGVLAFFAGVVLLTGRPYPKDLFGLLVGIDRYVLRVVAYASLMTTAYPPFRLDQSGDEPTAPGSGPTAVDLREPASNGIAGGAAPTSSPGAPDHATTDRATARTGAVLARVLGVLLILPGLALTGLGAVGLGSADDTVDGAFVRSPTRLLETTTAAITTGPVELELGADPSAWLPDRWEELRLEVTSTDDNPVFVGIAPRADVDAWLSGVAHDRVRTTGLNDAVLYDRIDGGPDAGAPTEQTFWVASSAGTGPQDVVWGLEAGEWVAVVAATDGTPGVSADVSVAARAPVVAWGSAAALAVGIPLLLGGLLLLVLGVIAGRRRRTPSDGGPAPVLASPPPQPSPVGAGTAAR
ncbi:DUF4389 domain-containing protein [Jannaschia sp. R86511]|uniref:DUF4389 domain-containing protein n=1 Tax=Jannaschia sp. R86511 TaxID=3093853 RepID=UPI0036D325E4